MTSMTAEIVQRPPLIEQVFAVLVRKWQANERSWVQVSHRQLADELKCSEGNLPGIMRRLEQMGRIVRQTWRTKWRRILVLQAPTDQPQALIDQCEFEQLVLPMELPPEAPLGQQRAVAAPATTDEQPIDRSGDVIRKNLPYTPPPPREPAPEREEGDQKLSPVARGLRRLGATARQIQQLLSVRPDRTLEELERSHAALVERYGDEAAPVLFGIWKRGQDVRARRNKEAQDEREREREQRGAAPDRPQRFAAHTDRRRNNNIGPDGLPRRIDAADIGDISPHLPQWLLDITEPAPAARR